MNGTAYPIRTLTKADFPPLLRHIPDQPTSLNARGSLPPRDNKLLVVVGSRRYSSYGKETVMHLIGELAGYPITIISGLALGIDALAHEAALAARLHTVAVPGSGIDDSVLYPRTNFGLGQRILKAGGGLLSEFEPTFKATPWSFLKRNRIMAGMAHATLIIEAKERSGTLVTARLALDYNRELLVVPGNIFAGGSWGPHMLMRDGAAPVTGARDILDALDLKPQASARVEVKDAGERTLLTLLEDPMDKDALIRASKLPAHEANILITSLELKGYIKENGGAIHRTISL